MPRPYVIPTKPWAAGLCLNVLRRTVVSISRVSSDIEAGAICHRRLLLSQAAITVRCVCYSYRRLYWSRGYSSQAAVTVTWGCTVTGAVTVARGCCSHRWLYRRLGHSLQAALTVTGGCIWAGTIPYRRLLQSEAALTVRGGCNWAGTIPHRRLLFLLRNTLKIPCLYSCFMTR